MDRSESDVALASEATTRAPAIGRLGAAELVILRGYTIAANREASIGINRLVIFRVIYGKASIYIDIYIADS